MGELRSSEGVLSLVQIAQELCDELDIKYIDTKTLLTVMCDFLRDYAALLDRQAQWPSDELLRLINLWRSREDNGEKANDFDVGYEQAMDECAAALQAVALHVHPTLSEALRALEHYAIAGTVLHGADASRLRATVDEMAPMQASSPSSVMTGQTEKGDHYCVHGDAANINVVSDYVDRLEQLQASAVPDGWVMVPKEPTYEMLVAGANANQARDTSADDTCRPMYKAMLAAPQLKVRP